MDYSQAGSNSTRIGSNSLHVTGNDIQGCLVWEMQHDVGFQARDESKNRITGVDIALSFFFLNIKLIITFKG